MKFNTKSVSCICMVSCGMKIALYFISHNKIQISQRYCVFFVPRVPKKKYRPWASREGRKVLWEIKFFGNKVSDNKVQIFNKASYWRQIKCRVLFGGLRPPNKIICTLFGVNNYTLFKIWTLFELTLFDSYFISWPLKRKSRLDQCYKHIKHPKMEQASQNLIFQQFGRCS